jgi:hypothetical protein
MTDYLVRGVEVGLWFAGYIGAVYVAICLVGYSARAFSRLASRIRGRREAS